MSSQQPAGTARIEESLLTVQNLTIRAGKRELIRHISFSVQPGQRVGIIGASGSGKTLTCLAVAGLLDNGLTQSGTITLAGFDVNICDATEHQLASMRGRLLGMVFQEPLTALNPSQRVRAQVAQALQIHPRDRSAEMDVADEVLTLLGAAGLDHPDRIAVSYPHQLSGGQRQRVVLAIALANKPPLLICDEPTTALDVQVQAKVLDLVDQQVAATNAALLFISHNLAVVAGICDHVLVMSEGEIVERGPVVDVLGAPAHPHTQQLVKDARLASLPQTKKGEQ